MTRAITSPELAKLRSERQWSQLFMAVLKPNTVYTARLASLPSSNDQVYRIAYNSGSGTLSNVKAGMTLLVGTSAGARDLGVCRIRTAPDATYFYIGEISEITWASNCYLTVIDDFDLWARHIHVDTDATLLMDVNIGYTDEHEVFDPVPVLGTHTCLWLTGASVAAHFDASDSWVFDSSISGYSWSAPGSSSSSGMTTATPTINYNAAGCYRVMCTVTAATGRTAMGVRYVFVYDDDHMPSTVFQLSNCEGSVDAGGWMFDVTMQAEASLTDLREGTLVVLFAKDYFNGTEQSIGPLANRENIVCVGRVGPSESIRWDPVAGQVHFNVQGPHFWMNKIKVSACQLEFTSGSPADWNKVKNLNVDRALWHLLHWRSTATIIMDFYPTNSTLYDTKIASLANYLWAQVSEFAGLKLMAHVLCDRFGRLFAEIDPQMVPEVSRSFPTVMTVTPEDWQDVIEFERRTTHDTGQVNISTRVVNSSGTASTVYSLSPGHIPRRHGDWEINDGMLASSQSDSNRKAGLLLGWKNNDFPDIPVHLAGNNRFIDIAPRQFLDITIPADENPRGVGYDGNIIPRRMALRYDQEARSLTAELLCEGETFEQISCNGDVPGDSTVDLSIPPLPPLPPLPDLPPILPGGLEPSATGPTSVLIHDPNYGFLVSSDFDSATPTWITVNSGLTPTQYKNANFMFVCPNGAFYVGHLDALTYTQKGTDDVRSPFIARASNVGGTFVIVEDEASLWTKYATHPTENHAIRACNYNPLVAESVAYIMGQATGAGPSDCHIYIGAGATFAQGASINNIDPNHGLGPGFFGYGISYGQNSWVYTGPSTNFLNPAFWWRFTANASGISASGQFGDISEYTHLRPSTTAILYTIGLSSGRIRKSTDNATTWNTLSDTLTHAGAGMDVDPSGSFLMGRWDTGAKGKSSDGGTTWAALPALPPGGWTFGYAGPGESAPRFVAGGATVYYSPDFGVSWFNKTGALTSVVPLPGIDMIRVLGY